MRKSLALFATSFAFVCAPAAAVVVDIDQFGFVKNGNPLFVDPFADGQPPPSAPNFANGDPASYSVNGTIAANAEANGRLRLNSANGASVLNANGTTNLSLSATLLTNVDPSNLINGLKIDDTFSMTGVFHLAPPQVGPLYSGYGIGFNDGGGGNARRNEWNLQLQYSATLDEQIVRFSWQDFDASTTTTLAFTTFSAPAGTDQISLTLARPSLDSFDLVGSFAYLDNGTVVGAQTFQPTGSVFQDRNWLRGFFFAAGIERTVPEPASLLLVLTGLLGAVALRSLRST
jgi:hypothetical protein